jgi:hypothetical protein
MLHDTMRANEARLIHDHVSVVPSHKENGGTERVRLLDKSVWFAVQGAEDPARQGSVSNAEMKRAFNLSCSLIMV